MGRPWLRLPTPPQLHPPVEPKYKVGALRKRRQHYHIQPNRLTMFKRNSLLVMIPILSSTAYAIIWLFISINQLHSLRLSVFNFGVNIQAAWAVLHEPIARLPAEIFVAGGAVLLSPLAYSSAEAWLVLQTIALASTSLLGYLIAIRLGLPPILCGIVSVVPLMYFGFAGQNLQGFNYEVLFTPFFMGSYLAAISGHPRLGVLLAVLASLLFFPVAALTLLFGALLVLSRVFLKLGNWYRMRLVGVDTDSTGIRLLRALQGELSFNVESTLYTTGVFLAGGTILLCGYALAHVYSVGFSTSYLLHTSSSQSGISFNLTNKVITILVVIGSVAFIPLLSPRWMLMLVPFFSLEFFVNYPSFVYPNVVFQWYTFLFTAFVFLGLIDGLVRLHRGTSWLNRLHHHLSRWLPKTSETGNRSKPLGYSRRRSRHARGQPSALSVSAAAGMALLISLSGSAYFLEPFGPGVISSDQADFKLGQILDFNNSIYLGLVALDGLIPSQEPRVLFQNDMPEILPRPILPQGSTTPFVIGPSDIVAHNLTFEGFNGGWYPIDPAYVLGNPWPIPFGDFSVQGNFPYNISMQQALVKLYGSSSYGIYGEMDGLILLKHNFTGPMRLYEPYFDNYSPSVFFSATGRLDQNQCGGCMIIPPLQQNKTAWYGPYTYLSPGLYRASFHLGIEDWNADSSILLSVQANSGTLVLNQSLVTSNARTSSIDNLVENITFDVSNGPIAIEFAGLHSNFSGFLYFHGVTVRQIAPPPTVFSIS